MTETIPYWKSNRFLKVFVHHEGEEGCIVCPDENIKLSMDRAPPPMRDPPANERARNPPPDRKKKEEKEDFLMNVIDGGLKTVETWRKFRAWIDSPPPAPQPKISKRTGQPLAPLLEPFDLQDICAALKYLNLPLAAKMFEKWFTGKLNYSLTNADGNAEINQEGQPYPQDMIDKTSISIDWVLNFKRAAVAKDKLLTFKKIASPKATDALTSILQRHKNNPLIQPGLIFQHDIQKIHREFQFQFTEIEGTTPQKLEQYLTQEVTNFGIPDELTFILGSFNLYAAISRATINRTSGGHIGTVTHVYVYARDGFTFTDEVNKGSQYLGHWSKKGISIVPSHQVVMNMEKINRVGYPIHANPLLGDITLMYPVRNSDFRKWQLYHRRGGDYIIYTNPLPVMLATPIKIFLPT